MSAHLISSRYAKSLLDLSIEQEKLDVIYNDMQGLKESLENKDLFLLLKSPIVNASKKNEILKAIFDGKVDPMTMSFLDLVVNKGREKVLPEIITAFIEQYKRKQNVSAVKITSASPLEESVITELKAELAKSVHTSEEIEFELNVDPSIIGGFVLQIGDKLYDASVAHQLGKLRKEFSNNSSIN